MTTMVITVEEYERMKHEISALREALEDSRTAADTHLTAFSMLLDRVKSLKTQAIREHHAAK